VPWYLLSTFFVFVCPSCGIFCGVFVFVRFLTQSLNNQQGEFKNTTKTFWGGVHVKNFWPKELRGKKLFSCRLPLRFFYRVFGRFSE
jgi:hypothetical protein